MRTAVVRPLRRYLDWRFDRIEQRIAGLNDPLLEQARALARIDVSRHNRMGRPPTFERPVSQVVSSAQFESDAYERWHRILQPAASGSEGVLPRYRKLWEWAYVLHLAELNGVLAPGRRAIGFGVGREPLPGVIASRGVEVLATDQAPELSTEWAATSQHMGTIEEMERAARDAGAPNGMVRGRYVDMTDVPDDVGTFHLVWSCGSLEHLGSPRAGLDFVLRTLDLLEPGGIAVHTTELDLVPQDVSVDYGHLAGYQPHELADFVEEVRARGFEMDGNWYVCLDTPEDRWISELENGISDVDLHRRVHLKVAVVDSVFTSVGLAARRPEISRTGSGSAS